MKRSRCADFFGWAEGFMKITRLVITGFMLAGSLGFAVSKTAANHAAHPEPGGFRGITWGRDISELKGFRRIESFRMGSDKIDPDLADYYFRNWRGRGYVRDKDNLSIGYASADEIIYLFRDNRFYGVLVKSMGNANRAELEKALTRWIGEPSAVTIEGNLHSVEWERESVRVSLNFRRTALAGKQDISLLIISREMEASFMGF